MEIINSKMEINKRSKLLIRHPRYKKKTFTGRGIIEHGVLFQQAICFYFRIDGVAARVFSLNVQLK